MVIRKGYKQTDIGLIPDDWTLIEIDSEIDLLTGYPFPSYRYASSGIKLLRGSNIKRGVIDWRKDITQYWEKVTTDLKPYILNEGDIVIAVTIQSLKKVRAALLFQKSQSYAHCFHAG